MPDGTCGVDDVARGQRKPGRYDGGAGIHMPDGIAGALQIVRAGCGEDRSADAAALLEVLVGSVHDGVDVKARDVLADDVERHGSLLG